MSSPLLLLFWAVGGMLVSAQVGDLPTVFIFGDSTVDVGTNNFITTKAKANFPYNGIDFPRSRSTGRFSNGFNSADEIVKLLGYKRSPPPFLALLQDSSNFQNKIFYGVNFASGGAGILDATGFQRWGDVITMTQQVQQFATVQGNITSLLGQIAGPEFFASSLFLISIGSNDIFDHYLYNETTVSRLQLMANLQSKYRDQLTALYNLGARKFGIVSVPSIGCCPFARFWNSLKNRTGCLTELNDDAQSFHSMIKGLLQDLSSQLKGMIYSLGDAFLMTSTFLKDPQAVGIVNTGQACCGKGKFNAEKACFVGFNPNLCPDRDVYLFWDLFHPTQHAARLAAVTLFSADPTFVQPMNFSRLAQASA